MNRGSPTAQSPQQIWFWIRRTRPTSIFNTEGVKLLEPWPQNITNPFQRFITAILEGQQEPELIDIKIHSDPEPNFEPRPEPRTEMKQPIAENRTKGTKLNLLKIINGDQNKFQKFLHTAKIYMAINIKDYDTNLEKIEFVLSFMTKGPAKAWADQYTKNALTQNQALGLNLRIYSEFRKALTNTFSTYNTSGDALNEMRNLRIKPEEDINSHITKFVTLLSESRICQQLLISLEKLCQSNCKKLWTWKIHPGTLIDSVNWQNRSTTQPRELGQLLENHYRIWEPTNWLHNTMFHNWSTIWVLCIGTTNYCQEYGWKHKQRRNNQILCDLEFNIGSKSFKEWIYITSLEKQMIILGFPWLSKHNPNIDWRTGKNV